MDLADLSSLPLSAEAEELEDEVVVLEEAKDFPERKDLALRDPKRVESPVAVPNAEEEEELPLAAVDAVKEELEEPLVVAKEMDNNSNLNNNFRGTNHNVLEI